MVKEDEPPGRKRETLKNLLDGNLLSRLGTDFFSGTVYPYRRLLEDSQGRIIQERASSRIEVAGRVFGYCIVPAALTAAFYYGFHNNLINF